MRKVILKMNELHKYKLIKKLVETNGNKNTAALKIGCSIRNVNRLIKKYKLEGKEGFAHKNKGVKPALTLPTHITNQIIVFYSDKYFGFNFKHFHQMLNDIENIVVSYSATRSTLMKAGFLSPKSQRKTKRLFKHANKNNLPTTFDFIDKEVDIRFAHPTRERKKYFGELVQMDASNHLWFGKTKSHLHLAIDDSTSTILGMYFTKEETLVGYYNVLHQILTKYGIPAEIITDNRTIFEYKKKSTSSIQKDTFTQFAYASNTLGIKLTTSSVAQAKGKVERAFNTMQDRLISEMRLNNVTNIEEANIFCKEYISKHNAYFASTIDDTLNVMEKQPSVNEINYILGIVQERVVNNGHVIKYKNKKYMTYCNDEITPLLAKTKVMVIEAFDTSLIATCNDIVYELREIENNAVLSTEFDEVSKPKKKKKYIPPMSHPWRNHTFNNFVSKQKHRDEFSAYTT